MLAIRLQRVGRSGYPVYRVAVQESQRHPSSGRIVAYVGTYNPHSKESRIQTELAQKYLDNGAQPSPRVVKLLKDAGVKMPSWVKDPAAGNKATRNPEKLRKNQLKEEVAEAAPEEPAAEAEPEKPAEETKE